MQGQAVFPPQFLDLEGPLAFLAGPIKGSERWQDEAVSYIQDKAPWLNVASPRKSLDRGADYTEHDYISQVDWETAHLRRADENGVIVFWFAKENEHDCARPFARTTRVEYGEWFAHAYLTGTKIVVGFDPAFDGDKYIRHRLLEFPHIPICETLEETLDVAIELARVATRG